MRPAWLRADRAAELLSAARGWRAAGLIDEAAFASIAAREPETGPRLGPIWRSLVFVCVVIGASTATAIGFISFGVREPASVGALLLLFGALLAAVTEQLVERTSFRPTGAEAATALLAAGYLGVGVYALLDARHVHGREALRLIHPWCAAVFGLAAWRWGIRPFAGTAALFALLFASQLPGARLSWVAAAALLAAGATAVLANRDLAPSHRDAVALVRIVALAALYLGVNYLSVDHGWIEELGRAVGAPRHRPNLAALVAAGIGSALVPLALLVWGLRSRDRLLADAGIVAAALSLATIRFYVHVAPLWIVLAAAGAVLAAASLLLERWLRSGRDGERSGYTAAPLYDEGRAERLLPVAAALAAAPGARALPDQSPGVPGAGGTFGGGGASGAF